MVCVGVHCFCVAWRAFVGVHCLVRVGWCEFVGVHCLSVCIAWCALVGASCLVYVGRRTVVCIAWCGRGRGGSGARFWTPAVLHGRVVTVSLEGRETVASACSRGLWR